MTDDSIRERLVRVETQLDHLNEKIDCLLRKEPGDQKSVVLPVAVVVMVIEVLKEAVVRLG